MKIKKEEKIKDMDLLADFEKLGRSCLLELAQARRSIMGGEQGRWHEQTDSEFLSAAMMNSFAAVSRRLGGWCSSVAMGYPLARIRLRVPRYFLEFKELLEVSMARVIVSDAVAAKLSYIPQAAAVMEQLRQRAASEMESMVSVLLMLEQR